MASLLADERSEAVLHALECAGTAGVPVDPLPVLTDASPAEVAIALEHAVVVGDRAFAPSALSAVRDQLLDELAGYHQRRHLDAGMDPQELRRACHPADPAVVQHALDTLLDDGAVASRGGRLALAEWEVSLTAEEAALRDRIAATIARHDTAPPRLDELAAELGGPPQLEALVGVLEGDGRLVRIEHDLFMDAAAMDRTVRAVRARFVGRAGLSPGDFREVMDLSRRHLMPLLAYLDREGITVRSGEGREVPS